MNPIRTYGPTLVLLVTVLITLIAGPGLVRKLAWAHTDARITLVQNEHEQSPFLAELSKAFRQVAQIVEPSVVSIEVSRRGVGRGGPRQWPPLTPEDLFRPPAPDPEDHQFDRYNPPVPFGQGSGWVYDARGHIITNNHVIANADEISVRFSNGARYEATVVGTDPNTDIAVLKVDENNLHPATIAHEPVEQGDIVFAFGSPLGFEFSVSQGIVSAKGRHLGITGQGGYENFIQTDAAINRGNSGGPLTNIYGQVVGMNTAIAGAGSPMAQAGFMGLGFAIPSPMIVEIADQLIETGAVQRGYLGIYINDLDPRLATTLGFEGDDGVLVADPIPNSPAQQAGIRPDDIITHIGDRQVSSADELRRIVAARRPGTTIDLRVFREGETLTVPVTLAELPDAQTAARPGRSPREAPAADERGNELLRKLGINGVQTFDATAARQLGTEPVEGVIVREVRPGSIAASAGLTRGAIITEVMGEPITTADELIEQLAVEAGRSDTGLVRLRVLQWDAQNNRFVGHSPVLELPED